MHCHQFHYHNLLSLALSLLMVDFRVHNSLTNHQNYKLILPSPCIFHEDFYLWKMHHYQFHYHNLLSLALSLLMVDFRVLTLLTNHQNYKLVLPRSCLFHEDFLWKMHCHHFHYQNLPSLALSILMVDFRVHTLLTNHQNYKLVYAKYTCVMKYALPQAQLLPPACPFSMMLECPPNLQIKNYKLVLPSPSLLWNMHCHRSTTTS